jgi:hypothetical protein
MTKEAGSGWFEHSVYGGERFRLTNSLILKSADPPAQVVLCTVYLSLTAIPADAHQFRHAEGI